MPPTKKNRIPIPKTLAAQVQFESDRTCCVCRRRDKPTQIHHIDEDPSNNMSENLAVLCLECHDLTQVRGGFARKLDADQVVLYRREWLARVRSFRENFADSADASSGLSNNQEAEQKRLRRIMLLLELARDANDWFRVALLYNMIGERDLRDKYIDMALPEASPYYEVLLRKMQGRAHELPEAVKQAALDDTPPYAADRFGMLRDIGRIEEASLAGLEMARESIENGKWFAAAFTLKNRMLPIAKKLFLKALEECQADGDLWWELRCYEELEWYDAAREFLLGNETKILESDNLLLQQRLAAEKGDEHQYAEITKRIGVNNVGSFIILQDRKLRF